MSVESSTPARAPIPWRLSSSVLFLFFLTSMFVVYWAFAWYFERIDLSQSIPTWYTTIFRTQMPPAFIFVRELFHWRVLRHFIPLIVGWWLAYQAAVGLVLILYDLPDRLAARRFLSQLIYKGVADNSLPITLNSETLAQKRNETVLLRIGGPGAIRVRNGYVAVTELNGRFHRLLGTGNHRLERFEFVQAVLDLRPQERIAEGVEMLSKDGIPIQATISIQFRISTGGEAPTRPKPFPFDDLAVRTAAYTQTVQPDGSTSGWDGAPLGMARGILTRIISKHDVDTILTPPGPTQNGTAATPLVSIRNDLSTKLKDGLMAKGIELIDVQISQVELPPDVTQQYIKYWQSDSEARIRMNLADGEATRLEENDMAQAEAEMTMIQAILEGVQRAKMNHNAPNMRDVVALRLVEALEKIARHSHKAGQVPLPNTLLTQFETFRHQLGDGEQLADNGDDV